VPSRPARRGVSATVWVQERRQLRSDHRGLYLPAGFYGACAGAHEYRHITQGGMCELECTDGRYGVGCTQKCDCLNEQSCDKQTGTGGGNIAQTQLSRPMHMLRLQRGQMCASVQTERVGTGLFAAVRTTANTVRTNPIFVQMHLLQQWPMQLTRRLVHLSAGICGTEVRVTR
jgi:hypothetical protein